MEGKIIVSPDGVPAIIAEQRESIYVIIKKDEQDLPYLDYIPVAAIQKVDDQEDGDLRRFYEHYKSTVSMRHGKITKSIIPPPSMRMGKIPQPSILVPKKVTVRGKSGNYIATRMVKIKIPKVTSQRKLTVEEKKFTEPKGERLATKPWIAKMTPSEDNYNQILNGNRDSMGNYIMSALWEKGVGEVETVTQVSLTNIVSSMSKRIMGVRPVGFEPSDILQEVSIRLMEMQDSGKLKEVPRQKFAAFVAQTVRNTSREILRRNNMSEQIGDDISEWADRIADEQTKPETISTSIDAVKIRETLKNSYNFLPPRDKIVFGKILDGMSHEQIAKELFMTIDAVKSRAKRAYTKLKRDLETEARVKIVGDDKGVAKLIKRILKKEVGKPKSFKASIILQNGKLLLKAKRYEVGEKSMATGKTKVAPGKWEFVGKDKKGKEKPEPKKNGDKKQKKEDVKGAKQARMEKVKTAMKDALKNFVNIMTDVFSGREGGETAAQAAQQEGRVIKEVSEASKQVSARKKLAKRTNNEK